MAEKKSTKTKSVSKKDPKKLNKQEPVGETQQPVPTVKPREFNWDVIGLSSAAITVSGAALLFMLGWAYESNWYGYFGVSMSQVTVQPQDVIIQSIPGVVTIVSCLSASVVAYYFLYLIYEFLKKFRDRRIVENLPEPEAQTRVRTVEYSMQDWLIVLSITEVLLLILLAFLYGPQIAQKLGTRGVFSLYEVTYIGFLTLIPLVVIAVTSASSIVIITVGFMSLGLYLKVRSFFLPTQKVFIDNPTVVKMPQTSFAIFFIGFLMLLTSLALSAVYGINDASSSVGLFL